MFVFGCRCCSSLCLCSCLFQLSIHLLSIFVLFTLHFILLQSLPRFFFFEERRFSRVVGVVANHVTFALWITFTFFCMRMKWGFSSDFHAFLCLYASFTSFIPLLYRRRGERTENRCVAFVKFESVTRVVSLLSSRMLKKRRQSHFLYIQYGNFVAVDMTTSGSREILLSFFPFCVNVVLLGE